MINQRLCEHVRQRQGCICPCSLHHTGPQCTWWSSDAGSYSVYEGELWLHLIVRDSVPSQGTGGPSSSCLCPRIYLCLGACHARAPSPLSGGPASPRQVALRWALFLLLEPLPQLQGGPDSQIQKVSTEFVTPSGRGRLGDTANAFPAVHHFTELTGSDYFPFIPLKYSWFAMYSFLLHSKVIQLY